MDETEIRGSGSSERKRAKEDCGKDGPQWTVRQDRRKGIKIGEE